MTSDQHQQPKQQQTYSQLSPCVIQEKLLKAEKKLVIKEGGNQEKIFCGWILVRALCLLVVFLVDYLDYDFWIRVNPIANEITSHKIHAFGFLAGFSFAILYLLLLDKVGLRRSKPPKRQIRRLEERTHKPPSSIHNTSSHYNISKELDQTFDLLIVWNRKVCMHIKTGSVFETEWCHEYFAK